MSSFRISFCVPSLNSYLVPSWEELISIIHIVLRSFFYLTKMENLFSFLLYLTRTHTTFLSFSQIVNTKRFSFCSLTLIMAYVSDYIFRWLKSLTTIDFSSFQNWYSFSSFFRVSRWCDPVAALVMYVTWSIFF
jgi:hypothetical protein